MTIGCFFSAYYTNPVSRNVLFVLCHRRSFYDFRLVLRRRFARTALIYIIPFAAIRTFYRFPFLFKLVTFKTEEIFSAFAAT